MLNKKFFIILGVFITCNANSAIGHFYKCPHPELASEVVFQDRPCITPYGEEVDVEFKHVDGKAGLRKSEIKMAEELKEKEEEEKAQQDGEGVPQPKIPGKLKKMAK